RRARMDDIGIRQLDATGQVIGERRFLGLFTSKAYAEEAAEIPLLRRVLGQILAAEQVVAGSHDYKAIVAIFNVLPKDDLFAARNAVRDLVRGWKERLDDELRAHHGAEEGTRLGARYRSAFPEAYRAATPPARAAMDVALLEAALAEGTMRVALGDDRTLPDTSALRVYIAGEPLVLSDFVPVLENLG